MAGAGTRASSAASKLHSKTAAEESGSVLEAASPVEQTGQATRRSRLHLLQSQTAVQNALLSRSLSSRQKINRDYHLNIYGFLRKKSEKELLQSKLLVFGVLKNYFLDEKRKSRNWRAAVDFEKKTKLEEAFFCWSLFVEKQKKMMLAVTLITEKRETEVKSRYFAVMLGEARKLLQLSRIGQRINSRVDLAFAVDCIKQMVVLSRTSKEEKSKQRQADLYYLSSVFERFRSSVSYTKYERQREEIGLEAATALHQELVFKKCLRGLREAVGRYSGLEQEAGLFYEAQLLHKGFKSFKKWLTVKNADVPIYSNRQVFLGYKYLGLLSGREGLRVAPHQPHARHRREAGISHIEGDDQSANESMQDFIPLITRPQHESTPPQDRARDWSESEDEDRDIDIDTGKQRGLLQLDVSQTSRPELEDLMGPLQQTSMRPTKTFQVYELPCITDRFNPRKIEQSNRRLNQLVLERLFSHWSNKVISKRSFKHSLALSLLKKTFVSLKQHTNEQAIQRFAEQRADKFFRSTWLSRSFDSLAFNAHKLAPLYRKQKHFELERNLNLLSKHYMLFRSSYLERKRLHCLERDADRYHLNKCKAKALSRLNDWKDRSMQLRIIEEAIAFKARKNTFRTVVDEWLRLIPEEGKTTRKELAAGKRAAKKRLAVVFQVWLRWSTELKMNKQLVESFQQRSRMRLKQTAFSGFVSQLSSLSKGRKFQVFIDSMHQRKLLAKALFSLQGNVGYERDKRDLESRFTPLIQAATLKSVAVDHLEPQEVVPSHILQSEDSNLRRSSRASLQESESAEDQRPAIALQEHHPEGQREQTADPPPGLLHRLEENHHQEAVPGRRAHAVPEATRRSSRQKQLHRVVQAVPAARHRERERPLLPRVPQLAAHQEVLRKTQSHPRRSEGAQGLRPAPQTSDSLPQPVSLERLDQEEQSAHRALLREPSRRRQATQKKLLLAADRRVREATTGEPEAPAAQQHSEEKVPDALGPVAQREA